MTFNEYCADIMDKLDGAVEQGTDEELFFAGYLNGHFSLLSARCQLQKNEQISVLQQSMQDSLADAFAAGELEPEDQEKVLAYWQSMQP